MQNIIIHFVFYYFLTFLNGLASHQVNQQVLDVTPVVAVEGRAEIDFEPMKSQVGYSDEEIFWDLYYELNSVYEDPSLKYLLYSDALLDDWDRKKNQEVAKKYGISVSQLERIYADVYTSKIYSGELLY